MAADYVYPPSTGTVSAPDYPPAGGGGGGAAAVPEWVEVTPSLGTFTLSDPNSRLTDAGYGSTTYVGSAGTAGLWSFTWDTSNTAACDGYSENPPRLLIPFETLLSGLGVDDSTSFWETYELHILFDHVTMPTSTAHYAGYGAGVQNESGGGGGMFWLRYNSATTGYFLSLGSTAAGAIVTDTYWDRTIVTLNGLGDTYCMYGVTTSQGGSFSTRDVGSLGQMGTDGADAQFILFGAKFSTAAPPATAFEFRVYAKAIPIGDATSPSLP